MKNISKLMILSFCVLSVFGLQAMRRRTAAGAGLPTAQEGGNKRIRMGDGNEAGEATPPYEPDRVDEEAARRAGYRAPYAPTDRTPEEIAELTRLIEQREAEVASRPGDRYLPPAFNRPFSAPTADSSRQRRQLLQLKNDLEAFKQESKNQTPQWYAYNFERTLPTDYFSDLVNFPKSYIQTSKSMHRQVIPDELRILFALVLAKKYQSDPGYLRYLQDLPVDVKKEIARQYYLIYGSEARGLRLPDDFGFSIQDYLDIGSERMVIKKGDSDDLALNLENMKINSLDGFRNIPDIETAQEIILGSNKLKELPPGVFQGLNAINFIGLNDNELQKLPSNIFQGLDNLRFIYLYDNKLQELPLKVFQGLNRLEHLNLSGNKKLKELPIGLIQGLPNLFELETEDTGLTEENEQIIDKELERNQKELWERRKKEKTTLE